MTAPASPEPSAAKEIEIVDLFAGPGGLDVAARQLGLTLVTGIEWDADACATRTAANLPTKQGDVRDYGPGDFPSANVLAGGPPCQTYTVAGAGAGRRALEEVLGLAKRMAAREDVGEHIKNLDDERTGLVLEPLRWALDAIDVEQRPYEAIVLEQVPAVLPVWEVVGEALDAEGYSVTHGILRTEEYGVPQTRRRAILIARYQGKDRANSVRATLPRPTHHPYRKGVARPTTEGGLQPWVTMNDVLKWPQSFEVISNYGTGGDPKVRGRRTSDEPSATVTGKISRNRVVAADGTESRFTNAEAGLLQTFPADHKWSGRGIAQQIGNAIPPRLAVHVLAAALDLGEEKLDAAIASLEASASPSARPGHVSTPGRVPAPAPAESELVSSRP
ncbi:DNA methylase [Streptomyces agglomeratus]|uniref:DNA (cytosine-5-)-methyltransferase n=1 Tax=Streptomyces agglomeratus TaxID=285458 RepID=A0A1E5PAY8_9ACTN|nr:DNA cytosine methyltransferase [Streptomyces agglomeratus]OEJ26721.1 DNA methylase [Streptomyces agglomeratus]